MKTRSVGIGTVSINAKAKEYINDILTTQRLSYGKYSAQFEKLFAKQHDSQFAIACNSGTSALHVGLQALKELNGWHDGDEIIVPSITFVASVNVILHNNLTPKIVDVDPTYYDLNADLLEAAITQKTKGIMVVHLFGQPANMTAILKVARKHNLKVIEDSCETMFAKHSGRTVGSWGDVACFSTYAAHIITTGVGGLCTTSDPEVATRIKSLFNHGRDNIYLSMDDDDNTEADNFGFIMENRFSFIHLGHSFRMTEMEAALGLAQLEEWETIIRPRQQHAAYLSQKLSPLTEYFQLPTTRENSEHVFMNYPILIKNETINREEFNLFLEREGIETRHLMPLTNQPIYKQYTFLNESYPVAETINKSGFYIGCHQGLIKEDLDYVVDAFFAYIEKKQLPYHNKSTTVTSPPRYVRKGKKVVQIN